MSDGLLDIIFPANRFCVNSLPLVFPQVCPVCERASFNGLTHPKCQSKYNLDGLFSLYKYEGEVRRLLNQAKFNPFLFSHYEKLLERKIEFPPWVKGVLVPIPLHFIKKHARGFNQAEIIAKKLNLPVETNLLKRSFFTKPQKTLTKKERQENIIKAFTVSPSSRWPSGSPAILIDDIWTTGATLRICGKLLKESGVKCVYAVTLAK